MGTARIIATIAVLLHMATVCAQTPYPELTIQDVSWMEGTHHYAVTNSILSPATPERPTEIGASADVEFVSATEVRLLPGFHAGAFNSQGQFHARIDQGLGQPADLVIISPAPDGSSPYGSIEDNVVHVHKWEKVEVGLRLPAVYQASVDSFFAHYYSNGTTNASTPWAVDQLHDINPYADDSLQVLMTLTRPDGSRILKWGFFMRESAWSDSSELALLTEDLGHQLHPYHIRFRFAPDMEGNWRYTISLRAPFTQSTTGAPMQDLTYSGYSVVCTPPLPDNKGHLEVNPTNRRILQFVGDPSQGDETPFFALGVNMADIRHGNLGLQTPPGEHWYSFYRRDFNVMQETMQQLSDVGGNFMRMFLLRSNFAPEWVNLGVYDAYRTPVVCSQVESTDPSCPDNGWTTGHLGNCQQQCWAFDRMLEQARASNIYLQLCIDPYPPVIAFEKMLWGAHPYVIKYLDPQPRPYDVKQFFYTPGPNPLTQGVFYFWKRKYKYIMSRWGWSVNVPIIEPFNEVDQMLTYRNNDLGSVGPVPSCADSVINTIDHRDICRENRIVWATDIHLPDTLDQWISDLSDFIRGNTLPDDPENSPLGVSQKLILMSYTDAENATTTGQLNGPLNLPHYRPFTNPKVDLIDVHRGQLPNLLIEALQVDRRSHDFVEHTERFWSRYPGGSGLKKPFNQGESQHYTWFEIPNPIPGGAPLWKFDHEVEKIFHNYDISFHNELWSSAFSGKFAAGTTWHWERVFWWPDALPVPPPDNQNIYQQSFSNALEGPPNRLNIGTAINPIEVVVQQKRIHYHFKPLSDLFNHPEVIGMGILAGDFTVEEFYDNSVFNPNRIECYFLKNENGNAAIGWIHNRNAVVAKSYYVKMGQYYQNLLGTATPTVEHIMLTGFQPGQNYYVYWFPTRLNTTFEDLPIDYDTLSTDGTIVLDLGTHPFNGVLDNFIDTLRSDYAFVISPAPIVKSLPLRPQEPQPEESDWDFGIFPNPTRDGAWLQFGDDASKDLEVFDAMGRKIAQVLGITELTTYLDLSNTAKGILWVRVFNGELPKVKKLILN